MPSLTLRSPLIVGHLLHSFVSVVRPTHVGGCQEEQSEVTLPFYFICLLHLANEKCLRLEGREDMLDFSVVSDAVGSH